MLKELIIKKDYEGIRSALSANRSLANEPIALDPHPVAAHPLHRLADGVFVGAYSDQEAVGMAKILIEFGADINGGELIAKKDTPLIAACSLNADLLALYYIGLGADIHHAGTHGGTALHWASWCGRPILAKALIEAGAVVNQRCIDFESTPLRWAKLGYERNANASLAENYRECERLLGVEGLRV